MKLRKRDPGERVKIEGFVLMELWDPNGKLLRRDEGPNLIVDEGLNFIIDTALSGSTQDTTFFVGLKDTGTPLAAWTLASGPTEITAIYSGNRPAWTENDTADDEEVSNSSSPASFSITGTDTVFGAFLATVNTGTAGTLIGAKDFTGGSQAVNNGDTLNVTYTITASSS